MKFIYQTLLCLFIFIFDKVKNVEIHFPFGEAIFPFLQGGMIDGNADKVDGESDGKPEMTSRSFMVNSNLGPIRVTQISVKRGKNLSTDIERNTPVQMIRNMDSFFDNMFDTVINDMIMNHQMMIRHHSQEDQQQEDKQKENSIENINAQENYKKEEEDIDTRLDEDKEPSVNHTNDNILCNIKNDTTSSKGSLTNKINEHISILTNKAKLNDKGQHKERKRTMFAQLCKYVFYSLIIFSLYVIIKKIIQLLDFVDPEHSKNTSSQNKPSKNDNTIVAEMSAEEKEKAELEKADKLN